MADFSALQEAIGYRFRDAALLRQALTHSSSTASPRNSSRWLCLRPAEGWVSARLSSSGSRNV